MTQNTHGIQVINSFLFSVFPHLLVVKTRFFTQLFHVA
ncbi:hypothetical protein MGSAQ_003255 [marine sediment metagenome]|uniref:Uncharacterized protein n=1 Tax=marine sediment metagenome TaxID=412755 RepID=A0A1B6NPC8_9ZZZZ